MLDHGSVSFGKFEFESLSWEKWSVFRHDRRQEELEKFNGLVAEKKAYFEEYYKRMRALKALQQQQQEEQAQQQIQQTELTLDYSVDGSLSEEEQETATGTKVEAEMKTGIIVEERRKDPEGCTVAENPSVGDTKSEMPIVGNVKGSDKKGSRMVSKRLMERKTISKVKFIFLKVQVMLQFMLPSPNWKDILGILSLLRVDLCGTFLPFFRGK